MSNTYFQFKQFVVHQERCAMKVCTDSCLFGAWASELANNKKRILDIGAGTGLLMLMLAQTSSAIIDGIEIEQDCFEQLKTNLLSSPWHDRLHAIAGDVTQFQFKEKYDFIISNPPFFSSDLLSKSHTNKIARHSTHLSLNELFDIVNKQLSEDGHFALLLPYHRLEEANEISQERKFNTLHEVIVYQTNNHKPFRVMLMYGKHIMYTREKAEIVIKDGPGYSSTFVELLNSFYLNL